MSAFMRLFKKEENANTKDAVAKAMVYKQKYQAILAMSGDELQAQIESNMYGPKAENLVREYEIVVKPTLLTRLAAKGKKDLYKEIIDLYMKARNRIQDKEKEIVAIFRAQMPSVPTTSHYDGSKVARNLQARLNAMRSAKGGRRRTYKKRNSRKTRRSHTRKH